MAVINEDTLSIENLVTQALKIPGVKVNRTEYLKNAFASQGILVRQIVEEGPVASDYSEIELDDMAEKLILKRTSESSALSFAAGLPGGLAMAATIPADTLQFFGMSLRMAQELAYLYGAKDFWEGTGTEGTFAKMQLIFSLGVMYKIDYAEEGLRLLSSYLAMNAMGGTPTRATTTEFWNPIVKKVGKDITLNLTKDTATKGIAKLIPLVGGFVSGGMTFVSMRPMGQKLYKVLGDANFEYDDSRAMKDFVKLNDAFENYHDMEQDMMDISLEPTDDIPVTIDGIGNDAQNGNAAPVNPPQTNGTGNAGTVGTGNAGPAPMSMDDVFATIEKLAGLKNSGAITQEEFDAKKTELLSRI